MRYIIVLVFFVVLLAGCGDKDSAPVDDKNKFAFDSTDIKLQPADNPAKQFFMEYKFTKGEAFNYRVTMISDMTQTVTADTTISMDMHQSMIYLLNFMPRETDADGNTELTCNITSSKIEMEGSGRKVIYHSDSIKTAEDKEKFADNHSIVKNPFSVRINKLGELLEVYKADKIVNSYLEYRKLADSASAEDKDMLKNQIVETLLKPLLSQVFSKAPEKPLAKDSIWIFKQPKRQMLVFQVDQTNKYLVKEVNKLQDDEIAVIGMEMETNFTGEQKVTEQGVSYSFEKPKISASGTMYFNISDGFIQKVKKETVIHTSHTAEGMTPQGLQKRRNTETIKTQNFIEKI